MDELDRIDLINKIVDNLTKLDDDSLTKIDVLVTYILADKLLRRT